MQQRCNNNYSKLLDLRLDIHVPSQGAHRLGIILDVLAVVEGGPQLSVERPLVPMVKVANDGLDGLGCFFGIVERDTAA
jgi:hypothetical protein